MGFLLGIILLLLFLTGLGVYTGYMQSDQIRELKKELTDRIQKKNLNNVENKKETSSGARSKTKESKKSSSTKKEPPHKDFESFLKDSVDSYREVSSPSHQDKLPEQEVRILHELEKSRKERITNEMLKILYR